MSLPVVDLHCDLLAYLNEDRQRNRPVDHASRCSLPLLKKGGVSFQVLAVYADNQKAFDGQLECYQEIASPQFGLAVENASGLLEEGEPFENLYVRFDAHPWVYVSLTWKHENRFGGGDKTGVGLKEDGKRFLEYMDGKGVAIDLSHTSDRLAEDILNHIDHKGLNIVPIASHSNFRSIKGHLRNLPDHFAKEIIARGGVIGINFVRHFVGEDSEDFIRHIEHGLALGGEDALVFGADFFGGLMAPELKALEPIYQETFSSSACYPEMHTLLKGAFSSHIIEKIFHRNAKTRLQLSLQPGLH